MARWGVSSRFWPWKSDSTPAAVRPVVSRGRSTGQAGFEQDGIPASLGPGAGLQRLPDVVAADGVQGHDAAFAPLAPFDHALYRFQAVEVIAVHAAAADAQRFLYFRAQRHVERRRP